MLGWASSSSYKNSKYIGYLRQKWPVAIYLSVCHFIFVFLFFRRTCLDSTNFVRSKFANVFVWLQTWKSIERYFALVRQQFGRMVSIGDRIVYGEKRGTILFVGEVPPFAGVWYGVDWDNWSDGKHDGSYKGVRYFYARYSFVVRIIRY